MLHLQRYLLHPHLLHQSLSHLVPWHAAIHVPTSRRAVVRLAGAARALRTVHRQRLLSLRPRLQSREPKTRAFNFLPASRQRPLPFPLGPRLICRPASSHLLWRRPPRWRLHPIQNVKLDNPLRHSNEVPLRLPLSALHLQPLHVRVVHKQHASCGEGYGTTGRAVRIRFVAHIAVVESQLHPRAAVDFDQHVHRDRQHGVEHCQKAGHVSQEVVLRSEHVHRAQGRPHYAKLAVQPSNGQEPPGSAAAGPGGQVVEGSGVAAACRCGHGQRGTQAGN